MWGGCAHSGPDSITLFGNLEARKTPTSPPPLGKLWRNMVGPGGSRVGILHVWSIELSRCVACCFSFTHNE